MGGFLRLFAFGGRRGLNIPALIQGETDAVVDPAPEALALKVKGVEYANASEYDLALDCFRRALVISPGYVDGEINVGCVLRLRGDFQGALKVLDRALRLNPEIWQAHFNRGLALNSLGDVSAAIVSLSKAVELNPSTPECFFELAKIYRDQKNFSCALNILSRAYSIFPQTALCMTVLGVELFLQGYFSQAYYFYCEALKLEPENPNVYFQKSKAEFELGLFDEHFSSLARAAELAPADYKSSCEYNMSITQLLLGDEKNGWANYEKRFEAKLLGALDSMREFFAKIGWDRYWKGESLKGKTIMIYAEQGHGDTIMMARFIPRLREIYEAKRVVVFCPDLCARVIDAVANHDVEVMGGNNTLNFSEFDVFATPMSFPFLMGVEAAALSGDAYLVPRALDVDFWRVRLSSKPGLKVGMVWAGNPELVLDAQRSVSLRQLGPILDVQGVTFVSLQKGPPAEQIKSVAPAIVDWMDECVDFYDTAALIAALDLVIAVDTAVVHVAGAVGAPAWMLNRYGSEWRWGLGKTTTTWYRSVKLYNQEVRGSWRSTIQCMAADLQCLVASSAKV